MVKIFALESLDITTPLGLQNKIFGYHDIPYFTNCGRKNLREVNVDDFIQTDEQNLQFVAHDDTG